MSIYRVVREEISCCLLLPRPVHFRSQSTGRCEFANRPLFQFSFSIPSDHFFFFFPPHLLFSLPNLSHSPSADPPTCPLYSFSLTSTEP